MIQLDKEKCNPVLLHKTYKTLIYRKFKNKKNTLLILTKRKIYITRSILGKTDYC